MGWRGPQAALGVCLRRAGLSVSPCLDLLPLSPLPARYQSASRGLLGFFSRLCPAVRARWVAHHCRGFAMSPHPVDLTAPRSNRSSCQESTTLTCSGSSTEEASERRGLRAWQAAVGCGGAVSRRGGTFLVAFLWRGGVLQTFTGRTRSCHLHQPGSADLSPLWPSGRARVQVRT